MHIHHLLYFQNNGRAYASIITIHLLMLFRTEFTPMEGVKYPNLSPSRPIVLAGSCFSANICDKMRTALWYAVNPLGALYNPISILNALNLALFQSDPTIDYGSSLFEKDGEIRSWLFDSNFAAPTREASTEIFIKRAGIVKETIERGKTLIVTFGTAWCFSRHLGNESVVGNCHKMPDSLFFRWRLGTEDIVNTWTKFLSRLSETYPGIHVVFTVSPVRHLKDGFEGNKRSKAILLLAVEELCGIFPFCSYFPAYEILNDDLRDYRFYASDMTHPAQMAIDYVWEKLRTLCISEEDNKLLSRGEKISAALLHRPMSTSLDNPDSPQAQAERQRILSIREKYNSLKKENPNILPL